MLPGKAAAVGPTTVQLEPDQMSELEGNYRSTAGAISSWSGSSAARRIVAATFGSLQRRCSRGPSRVYSKEPVLTQHTASTLLAPLTRAVQLPFQLDVHFLRASERQLAMRRNRFTSLPVEFSAGKESPAVRPSSRGPLLPSTGEEQLRLKHRTSELQQA